MNAKLKSALKYSLMFALAAALLWLSFRELQWRDFIAGLKACRWGYVVFAMAVSILAFYIRALRWRELIVPIDPSTTRLTCLNAINIGYIVNIVLPRVGEFVRCGYVTKHSAKGADGKKLASYDKVLGTMVADRMWDLVTMLLLIGAVMALSVHSYGTFFMDKVIAPVTSSLNMSLGTLLLIVVAVFVFAVWLIVHFRNRHPLFTKLYNPMMGIWHGVISCFKMKSWWKFAIYSLLIWACYWMMSAGVLWAVQGMNPSELSESMAGTIGKMAEMGLDDALFLMLVGGVSSLVPVPGGFGAFHYLVSLAMLTIYGIPVEVGVIFATLSHESQIVTEILCGGFSYVWETLHPEKK